MPEHTASPWYCSNLEANQPIIASEVTGETVAVCYTNAADARLLEAAPELLGALNALLEKSQVAINHPSNRRLALEHVEARSYAFAAIAKATGE